MLKKDTKNNSIRKKKINQIKFILFKAIFDIRVNKQHTKGHNHDKQ